MVRVGRIRESSHDCAVWEQVSSMSKGLGDRGGEWILEDGCTKDLCFRIELWSPECFLAKVSRQRCLM